MKKIGVAILVLFFSMGHILMYYLKKYRRKVDISTFLLYFFK